MSGTTPTATSATQPRSGKDKPRVLILECTIKGDSGFVKEGTIGTPFEERRTSPSVVAIPPVGYGWDATGSQYPIRYIKNQPEISIEKLREKGINTPVNDNGQYRMVGDKIIIKHGTLVLKEEGDLGMFRFMEAVSLNENALNRPEYDQSQKYFKVVEPLRDDEDFNDRWLIQNEAESYVAGLVQRGANKEKVYKTEKIDAILQLFNKYGGENYPQKLTVLASMARQDGESFLKRVKALDDVAFTLVVNAEELNVITIGKKSVEFVENGSVLAIFEDDKMSKDKRVKHLAELLKTSEYAAKFQELSAAIDLKQKQSIEN